MAQKNAACRSPEVSEILSLIKDWINQINRPLSEAERKKLIEMLCK